MAARITIIVCGVAVLFITSLADHEHVQFSYSGETGPEKWGSLSPAYSQCSNGKAQSPINIVKKDAVLNTNLQPLNREYHHELNATLINNGFNIGVLYDNILGVATISGKNYTIKRMHWHSPSEHTIDGVRYPLELHMVHMAPDGSITVVAVLFQYGEPDPLLSQMKKPLDELIKEVCGGDEEAHIAVPFLKTGALERSTRKYFRYEGSLTTPPCSEKVIWNILGKVRDVSKEQVDAIKAPLDADCKNNSRPLQPLNGRRVELYNEMNEN